MPCQNTEAHDGTYFSYDTWGFIVYRLTYKDQALWDDYLEYIRKAVRASIDWRLSEELWIDPDFPSSPHPLEAGIRAEAEWRKSGFHLCLREGPELDGCSIEDVGTINSNWLLKTRPPIPAPGSDSEPLKEWDWRMRDLCCVICVDDEMLQRFQEIRSAKTSDPEADWTPSYRDDVAVKMIWTGYPIYDVVAYPNRPVEEEEENELNKDRRKFWQYFHVHHLPIFVNDSVEGLFIWFDCFARPPRFNRVRLPGQ